MKKTMMIAALMMSGIFLQQANAQLKLNLSINVGSQPVWGPTGYDHADYYYLPDIDCYYDISKSQFIYNNGHSWVFASRLPARYSKFDLYNGYKVVINEPKPYLHADLYRNKYRNKTDGHEKQLAIRDSREEKYYQVKGHPMHGQWVKTHGDNDHGRGTDRSRP